MNTLAESGATGNVRDFAEALRRWIDGEASRPHYSGDMYLRMLVMLAFCCAAIARGQAPAPESGTRSLSLVQCIDLALTQNLNLQIEHLSTQLAAFELGASYGIFDPVLSFRAVHDYTSQPGDFDAHKFNPDFPFQQKTDIAGMGLTGTLPLGLSYQFGTQLGRKSAVTDFTSDLSDAAAFPFGIRTTNNAFADVGVTLRQHLLKDFWIDRERQLIRLRRADLKISEQALQLEVMKTVLAVELAYWDLLAARELIRADEEALKLKQQFVAETKRRVEVGDLPPLDADQAETQLQNAVTRLTAARELYGTRQNGFKALITDNYMEWADLEILPAETLVAVAPDVQRSESFRRALSDRPDLLEARLAVQKSDVSVKFRHNQLFPSLDLIGRYADNGVQPDSSDALSDAYRFADPSYFYGVVVSVPLTRQAERNQYRASKAGRQLAELQLRKAEQAVFVEVADWVNRVQSRFSQADSTRKARGFAEAALAAEEKKLQNGLSTSFFVLQLQETLAAARSAEVQALADYNKALAELAFAEGGTLSRHHLRVEVR